MDEWQTATLAELNSARAAVKLPALEWSPALADAAQQGAMLSASMRSLRHWFWGWRMGHTGLQLRAAGECAYQAADPSATPHDVATAWLADPAHKAIVLGPFTHAGAGRTPDGGYVFTDFACLWSA